jgi:hypothetical protein
MMTRMLGFFVWSAVAGAEAGSAAAAGPARHTRPRAVTANNCNSFFFTFSSLLMVGFLHGNPSPIPFEARANMIPVSYHVPFGMSLLFGAQLTGKTDWMFRIVWVKLCGPV